MYVPLAGEGDVTLSLPKYPANQRLSAEIVYRAPLKPPIKKGDQVATLRIQSTSSASAEVPLYAEEDVAKPGHRAAGPRFARYHGAAAPDALRSRRLERPGLDRRRTVQG